MCRQVLEEDYTLKDSYVSCKGDYYNNIVFPLNLSLFIVLSLIIPLFLIYKLRKKN